MSARRQVMRLLALAASQRAEGAVATAAAPMAARALPSSLFAASHQQQRQRRSAFSDHSAHSARPAQQQQQEEDQQHDFSSASAASTTESSNGPWIGGDDAAGAAAASRTRAQLLDAALAAVPTHGWTPAALAEGARSLGLSPAVAGLLPRREASLVEYYSRALNARLARELESSSDGEGDAGDDTTPNNVVSRAALKSLPTRSARVARVLRRRLEMQREHLESWPQALAALAAAAPQPGGAAAALELLADVADLAVRAAEAAEDGEEGNNTGPSSSSPASYSAASWYAQRTAAAAAYASSELYMQTDCSPGFSDTWEQMARRLEDAERLGGVAELAGGAVESGVAAVARLLGFGGSAGVGLGGTGR